MKMQGTITLVVLLVIAINTPAAICKSFPVKQWGYLKNKTGILNLLTSPPTTGVQLHYTVTLPLHLCCLVLYLGLKHEDTAWNNATRCFGNKCNTDISGQEAIDPGVVYLAQNGSSCSEVNKTVVCTGKTSILGGVRKPWVVKIGPQCMYGVTFDIFYNLTLQSIKTTGCEKLRHKQCTKYYKQTCFPNMLGFTDQGNMKLFVAFAMTFVTLTQKCYQHLDELICYIGFPKCRPESDGSPYLPCRRMCEEGLLGCQETLLIPNNICVPCKLFPNSLDPKVCFYKNVTCGMPPGIQNGTFTNSGTSVGDKTVYSCNNGFYTNGESVTQCKYSGLWHPSTPICTPILHTMVYTHRYTTAYTIVTLVVAIFVITTIILLVRYRLNIQVILYNRYGFRFKSRPFPSKTFHAYLAYSWDSFNIVDKLREQLEGKGYIVCFPIRDFLAGDVIQNSIISSIWNSNCAVAIFSEEFMTDGWCQFAFYQAHLHSVNDKDFRLIVLASSDFIRNYKNINCNMPKLMKSYMDTKTYIQIESYLYIENLIYHLPDLTQ